MNKRITSLLLCFVMVFSILATAVPVLAATVTSTQIKVTPDKTTASPGDIITYTITIGPVSDMGAMSMRLDIPTGLTYVENTGKLVDDLKTTLGFDVTDWTEITKMVSGYASAADYESTTDTELAKFQCKVDDGATGSLEVGLKELEFGSCQTFEYHTDRFSVVKTPVTITAAPKPATNVTLNKSTTTIYTGGSETLVATVSPADTTDTVTWESNKTSVATVDSTGKVSAVAPGTAIITAKAGSKSATCTVTVEDAPCTHASKSDVSAKSSTCQDQGWDAYKMCDTCGQLFDTADNQISEIPFRSLASHTGGTATCKDKAVCTVCGQPYGSLATTHSYTAQTKTAEALKTAGTCKDNAVYYYSCSVCGAVEHNDAHTFVGEKDATNHTGGIYLNNQKEANCKEEGYTGDTHCLGCEQKLSDGTTIGKAEHNPSTLWSGDNTKHWKECTNVIGCGVKLQEGNHTSTGDNVATCKHKAVCDTCLKLYGDLGDHDWTPATCSAPKTCRTCGLTEGAALNHTEGTEWKYDADNHWHVCTAAGCGVVIESSKAAHTPDREAATETEPVKCSVCEYIITPALGHTHDVDTAKFESNETNHWNTCSGCTEKHNTAAHTFEWKTDKEATATEKGSKHEECTVCGYKKAAVEIPATGTTTEPTNPSESTTPTKPENTDSPQTGDNSMMGLWIALLFVSGAGVVGTTVFSRKRRSTR